MSSRNPKSASADCTVATVRRPSRPLCAECPSILWPGRRVVGSCPFRVRLLFPSRARRLRHLYHQRPRRDLTAVAGGSLRPTATRFLLPAPTTTKNITNELSAVSRPGQQMHLYPGGSRSSVGRTSSTFSSKKQNTVEKSTTKLSQVNIRPRT